MDLAPTRPQTHRQARASCGFAANPRNVELPLLTITSEEQPKPTHKSKPGLHKNITASNRRKPNTEFYVILTA